MTERPALFVDLRCLQDENFRERGVGRHALGLLKHARASSRFAAAHKIVGIVDRALPSLAGATRALVDGLQQTGYVGDMAGSWFVELSPMTHDPLFTARLAGSSRCLAAAAVYDFIPHDFPTTHLPDAARRLDYAAQLAWLSRYELFMPISQTSADRLRELLGVPARDVTVTGAPLDPAFERAADVRHDAPGRHLLVVGGGDARKNVECPIRAHAGCAAMADIPIVVTGHYGPAQVAEFQRLHRECGGRAGLRVPGHVDEAELLRLYREASCVVTASRAEGFSLPVVEAMAAGVPSVASRIAAHRELVEDEALLFDPDGDAALSAILAQSASAGWRSDVVARQAPVWPRFRAVEVARLFWSAMQARADAAAPAEAPRRPRVALLSPVPPDRSGVADYTAACCVELGKHVDLHVFTATDNPAPIADATVAALSAWPVVSPEFDRVAAVMGNSHLHAGMFHLLMRYGGACVCHDARLVGFYDATLGRPRATATAEAELGRPLLDGEIDAWLADESKLEATFLGEVAAVAEPLIFHSAPVARVVAQRFGARPVCLPFSIYRTWSRDELSNESRNAARKRVGVDDGEIFVATFGFVAGTKAPEECMWAIDLLRGWQLPVRFAFVGASLVDTTPLLALRASLGLGKHVELVGEFVDEQTYRDYLLAADCATQLRSCGMGSLSGALLDCVASGLPTVANQDVADASGSPAYVRRVPNDLAPLSIAGSVAEMVAERDVVERDSAERRDFEREHNFQRYSELLRGTLGLIAL